MEPSRLIDELSASVRLAGGSGTLLLLIGKDGPAVVEAMVPVLASLRVGGPFQVEDLGTADAKLGPRAWVAKMRERRERPADAFALMVQPDGRAAALTLGKRLNGEREHLRQLPRPLLLFMSAEDERALRAVAPDFFTWSALSYELPPASELLAHARRSGAIIDATASIMPPTVTVGATLATAVVTPPPIRFLHLSDVHFKTGAAKEYDQGKVLDGLLERLRKDREALPIDLVFFTGDLANTADEREYARAIQFLRALLDATDVDPDHLFVVPGNHDVVRSIGRWALRTLDSSDASADFFVEAESRRLHEPKFAVYRSALSGLLGKDRPLGLRVGDDAVEVVEVRGARVAVASFNSAWFAVGDDDLGKLWLGEANVDRAAQRIAVEEGVAAAIALMHHPTEFLSENERSAVENHLERSFDVVLRGHLHKDKARSVSTGRGGYVELAAPAAYQGSQWPNGCVIGELELSPRALRVRPYKFGAGADPWTPDHSVFPDDEDGSHTFSLRPHRRGREAARILRALGPEAARETGLGVDRPNQVEIRGVLPHLPTDWSWSPSDVLDALRASDSRPRPSLMRKLGLLLATIIPPPPGASAPWGRDAFEALLTRFVSYWGAHRDAWLEDLGDDDITYKLAAGAFFARQSGQPVRHEVRSGAMRADLLIGEPDDGRAVVEISNETAAARPRAIARIEPLMDELQAGLGAVLWFRPDRPGERQEIEKVDVQRGDRAAWLVSLATPVGSTSRGREQLLHAVIELLPAQFDVLVARLAVPVAYLSGPQAPLAQRSVELLRWAENTRRLADLARFLEEITSAPTPRPA